jgi:hypothetical protein
MTLGLAITRIDTTYSIVSCVPTLYGFAKGTLSDPNVPSGFSNVTLATWDGSVGWANQPDVIYSNGLGLYGLGIQDATCNRIMSYSSSSHTWSTVATFTEPWSVAGASPNVLSKSSSYFIATPDYPKRWN